MSEYSMLLSMLNRAAIEHTIAPISNINKPNESQLVEIFGTNGYGSIDQTSVWIFDKNGSLLRVGQF